jgi:phosphoenolpyruvate phosphomutase
MHDNVTTPISLAGGRLRRELSGPEPCQLMGAHDGLSARIAVDAGFTALWASGLCMSTALGIRDCDEASWTELLDIGASIVSATSAPVLVDGDAGYGNFNIARRFARRAERLGAAGVCFEDKRFPKMNSFFGDEHALSSIQESCGKIAACKEGQEDPSFVVVARTEALVAGRSIDEALERAQAYVDAGADAVFVHSRKSSAVEIEAFMAQWDAQVPVIVAPTTYPLMTLAEFQRMGVSGVIWANQSLRASFAAMRAVCRQVRTAGSVAGLDGQVASLAEMFELLGYDQLVEDAQRYAPDRDGAEQPTAGAQ